MKTNYQVFEDAYQSGWVTAGEGWKAGLRALGLDPNATGGVQALRDEIDRLTSAVVGANHRNDRLDHEIEQLKARKPKIEVPALARSWAVAWKTAVGLEDKTDDATAAARFILSFFEPTIIDQLMSVGLSEKQAQAACEVLERDPYEVST